MKRMTWQRAGWAMLMVALAASAPAQTSGGDAKRGDTPRMLKIIDPELLARMVQLASSAKTCDVEAPPNKCMIEMTMIEYQGKKYCVAVAPEVQVKTKTSGGPLDKKRIVWELDHDELDSKALVFHKDAGVVITIDDPLKKQVDTWGKLGDGSGGQPSPQQFHTKTQRNKKGASATYLPVVLWGQSGYEELCAAVDPKITNY